MIEREEGDSLIDETIQMSTRVNELSQIDWFEEDIPTSKQFKCSWSEWIDSEWLFQIDWAEEDIPTSKQFECSWDEWIDSEWLEREGYSNDETFSMSTRMGELTRRDREGRDIQQWNTSNVDKSGWIDSNRSERERYFNMKIVQMSSRCVGWRNKPIRKRWFKYETSQRVSSGRVGRIKKIRKRDVFEWKRC